MSSLIYYGVAYFVEALIIWQYSTQMFPSKYRKSNELCSSILLYVIPLCFSLTENVWFNILSFIIVNYIYIHKIFAIEWYIALFHAAIATAVMSITELLSSAIFSHLTYSFYQEALVQQNLSILAVVSKLLYHLSLQIIALLFAR